MNETFFFCSFFSSTYASRFQVTDEVQTDTKPSADQDDESNIDLDTRIAMMFEKKSFGAAPPFLQLDDSDSDAEKDERLPEADASSMDLKIKAEINTDNSTGDNSLHTPNEAISNDSIAMTTDSINRKLKIKTEKKNCIEDGASDISSDDELLLKSSPKGTSANVKLDDDKMSLSSLSSTEDKMNRKPIDATSNVLHKNSAIPPTSDYYYPPGTNPYYYPTNGGNHSYDPYQNQYMSSGSYMQPYVPGFSALIPGGYVQSNDYSSNKYDASVAPAPEPKKDKTEQTVSSVIERVTSELKQILKKDFNKRMIESIAYKQFEAWWDEQVRNKSKPISLIT